MQQGKLCAVILRSRATKDLLFQAKVLAVLRFFAYAQNDRAVFLNMQNQLCDININEKAHGVGHGGDERIGHHRGVDAETFNAAAYLLGSGIDTEKIYAELYLDDISFLKYKSAVYDSIELTPNGVAYVFIPLSMRDRFGLDAESASLAVSFLESIRGSLIWIAFIENGSDDPAGAGTVRVRLRSRFLDIDAVAAKYGGGGHARAAGATLRDREEINDVLADADRLLGEFKSAHGDLI